MMYHSVLSAIVPDFKSSSQRFVLRLQKNFCAESHELFSAPGNRERLSNNYASSGSNTNFTGRRSEKRNQHRV